MDSSALTVFAAVLAVLGPAMTAGISIGIATSKAADAISRQPEAGARITSATLLGAALAEATAIYGFVIALVILLLK